MTASRVQLIALLAVVLVGLSIAPAGSAAPVDGQANTDTEAGMGTELSTFMQSSSAEASERVDSGLFAAGYDRADDDRRPAVVDDRTNALEERLAELQAERDRLNETYRQYEADGEEPPPRLEAQLTRLTVQLDTFEDAVNETDERARAVGADTDRLDRLRTGARNLSGQEVAEIARGIAGVDPPRGPPDLFPGPGSGDDPEGDDPAGPTFDVPGGPITDPGDGDGGSGNDGGPGDDGDAGEDDSDDDIGDVVDGVTDRDAST